MDVDIDKNICIKMDKIDNLFTTTKSTPLHIIKTTLNKITNNIIEKIENNDLEHDIYFGDIYENSIARIWNINKKRKVN